MVTGLISVSHPREVLCQDVFIRSVVLFKRLPPPTSLAKELEESDRKLTALTEEQTEEQRRWQEELQELRTELESVRKEAQKGERLALQDERAAVEKQRDVAMTFIEAWQREVTNIWSCCELLSQSFDVITRFPVAGRSAPEHHQGGVPTAVSSREAELGEEGRSRSEEQGRAREPLPGGSAAAPAGSRVGVPAQDQSTVSSAGSHGTNSFTALDSMTVSKDATGVCLSTSLCSLPGRPEI